MYIYFCLYNYNISHDISFSSLQVNPKSGIPGISPDLHQQLTGWNSKVGRIKETCLHGNLGGHSAGVQDTLDDPQGHRYLDETCSVHVCSDVTFATSASLVFPLCFTPPQKKSHCVTWWLVPYLLIGSPTMDLLTLPFPPSGQVHKEEQNCNKQRDFRCTNRHPCSTITWILCGRRMKGHHTCGMRWQWWR